MRLYNHLGNYTKINIDSQSYSGARKSQYCTITYKTVQRLLGHGWLPWNKQLGGPYVMLQTPDWNILQMTDGVETTWQSGQWSGGHNHQYPE